MCVCVCKKKTMLKIPENILKKLVCAYCDGYLCYEPVMLNGTRQICGKCFKILPDEQKTQCIKQIGYEAIAAELLIFPCRYHRQGCQFTFQWNRHNDHELTCEYRFNTLPLLDQTSANHQQKQQQQQPMTNIYVETIKNSNFCGDKNSAINVEESAINRQVLNCRVNDAIIHQDRCINCKNLILNENYYCSFGHKACRKCKGNVCSSCATLIGIEPYSYCKNQQKGCNALLQINLIKKHEIDCEFNNSKCPLCLFNANQQKIIEHFLEQHQQLLIHDRETTVILTRKDHTFYFYCYNRLFICKYYHFGDSIEFILQYVGCNDEANNYKYDVCVLCDYFIGKRTKRTKCLGWNQLALEKAITYQIKEEYYSDRLRFEAKICILHVP